MYLFVLQYTMYCTMYFTMYLLYNVYYLKLLFHVLCICELCVDIGEHMQDFVKKHKIPFQDRNYLIGSMFANKILLITPLVKWYVQHGIEVTKIHQLIEFQPKR